MCVCVTDTLQRAISHTSMSDQFDGWVFSDVKGSGTEIL